MSELWVSVRSNANKDRPVFWERDFHLVLHNDLVEEDCDCEIVIAESRANLMLHMLTLENYGAADLWNDICIDSTITIEETKWAVFLRVLFLWFMNVFDVIQEYNHCKLA